MTENNLKTFNVLCQDLSLADLVRLLIIVTGYIDKHDQKEVEA